jgi:putative tryptophan/tyrosine transport system substrate-binding protein
MLRRSAIFLLGGMPWAVSGRPAARILIVSAAAGPSQDSAIESMRQLISESGGFSELRHLPADEAGVREQLKNGTQLIIAVGMEACRYFAGQRIQVPVIATMALRSDLDREGLLDGSKLRLSGAVWLDLSVAQVVTALKVAFPEVTRIGVLRSRSLGSREEAGLPGNSAVVLRNAICPGPAELLPTLRELRGHVDFVLCLPDATLYNRTTIEPLIRASLEHRLPLIGFSGSFVRAGAAAGVYPDFGDVGRQTAALALRCLSDQSQCREETPRRTTLAINQRVLRLFGQDYKGKESRELVLFR